MNNNRKVVLAWATKKRHIAIDGEVLCQRSAKTSGYSVKNGQHNSISLSGLPDYKKILTDVPFSHTDGIIEFLPIDKQKIKLDTRSICSACLKKYNKFFGN